jgi:hypothetical protein
MSDIPSVTGTKGPTNGGLEEVFNTIVDALVSALEEIKEAIFRCALELSERSDSESAGDTGFSANTGEEGGD